MHSDVGPTVVGHTLVRCSISVSAQRRAALRFTNGHYDIGPTLCQCLCVGWADAGTAGSHRPRSLSASPGPLLATMEPRMALGGDTMLQVRRWRMSVSLVHQLLRPRSKCCCMATVLLSWFLLHQISHWWWLRSPFQ